MTVYLTFSETGVTAPETSEIKSEIQSIFTTAFGVDLNLDDSTPQGYIIDKLTEIIANQNSQMLYLINQFNPSFASGNFQTALGALYFLERKPATPTIVQCECRGLSGTVLGGLDSKNPAQAQNTDGEIFICTNTGVIPASGVITLQFQSANTGAISAPANTVNRIYRQIAGWDSVNNPSAGVEGRALESRNDYEARRRNSLAVNSIGSKESVYSKVYNVDNVTDCTVVENDSSEPVTIQGITLSRNSIYVVVSGGDNTEIAEAIRLGKSAGCATNGSTEILLPGDYIPLKFDRPTNVNVYIKVVIIDNGNLPNTYVNDVKKAILANFNGTDGSARITIGESVFASRFYSPVTAIGFNVSSLTVSKNNSTFGARADFNLNQLAVLGESNITVSLG